jgi:four helix bundle protein
MNILQNLQIWHKAMDLAALVYEATVNFPKEEKYGLTSQIRRAAVSIPSNIAEGAGRNSDNEFVHFLAIAHGSSYELQTQILLSEKFDLITKETSVLIVDKIIEFQKMNYALQNQKRKAKM